MTRLLSTLVVVALAGCGAHVKRPPGFYDPHEATSPGDAVVGPFGEANSPGIDIPGKKPPKRR